MLGSNGLLLFGLASTLTILICHLLGLEQSYRLACFRVAMMTLVWAPGPPWSTVIPSPSGSLLRTVEALLVSALLSQTPSGRLHNPRVDV
jgi:hypothetical protein